MKIDRVKIHAKCNGNCGYCGTPITVKEMQVDHIIAQSNFFATIMDNYKTKMVPSFLHHLSLIDVNHIDNLMPSCRYCNKHKTSHHLELYRSEIFEQVNRLNKYNSNYRIAKRYGLIQETVKPIKFYFEEIGLYERD